MPLSLENIIGQKLMWSFHGHTPPPEFLAALTRQHVGGVTLFRSMNLDHPAQIRELTDTLQRAAREANQPPLLIGVDQEGGTLMAVPGTTRFPGNLALGATRSTELAYRTGFALGRELAALGINVNYAPVCDVINNPQNPVVGPRSFGAIRSGGAVGAAMIRWPASGGRGGHGQALPRPRRFSSDSHHGMAVLPHDEARLRAIEFVPFQAAIQAGVKLIMTAHIALPDFDDGYQRPATLSPRILKQLLRDEMKFGGVIISDAMDMHAIQQGPLHVWRWWRRAGRIGFAAADVVRRSAGHLRGAAAGRTSRPVERSRSARVGRADSGAEGVGGAADAARSQRDRLRGTRGAGA